MFDAIYTKQKVFMTPPDPMVMLNMDEEEFMGFSYVNSNVNNCVQCERLVLQHNLLVECC